MKILEKIYTFMVATILILSCLMQVQSSILNNEISGTPIGWTDDIRLTNETTQDVNPSLNLENGHVHLVWEKDTTGAGGHYDIFYINSNNNGNDWCNPVRITNGVPGIYCRNPQIGVNDSNLHAIWDDNDAIAREIKYCSSLDGGQTWNPPKMISVDDGWNSQYAKIAVNGSQIHVVWVDERHRAESLPWNTELYYMRSLDGGITWDDGLGNIGQERRLTNALYESTEPSIAVEGDVVQLIWGDTRNGVTIGDVYYMRSLDKGATWDDGLGNIGQDRRLTINNTNHMFSTMAMNGSSIHVAWVDEVWPGPNYYIYYRNNNDNGATWEPIQLLTGPSQMIVSPDIDVAGNEVNVVWDDSRNGDIFHPEIYFKNSTDGGMTWNPDLRLTYNLTGASQWPRISIVDGMKHVVWWDDRDGNSEIYYKRFPDFSTDTTPPTLTYISPPTPPDNATLATKQKAVIRVHYYENESAASNATLFWKNSTGTWNSKPMTNISFWNGSYNNYFEANFTESSPTTVTYYVNCTSSANLTTMAPIRTLNFANISVNDPYPIYGYAYLYNGAGGIYNPLPLINAQVEITWWNVYLNNWQTITTNTIGTGQYSVDIMNYTNGGVVFCNATAPAPFSNRGYNWTIVDVAGAPGGRQQNIVCGVPYDIVITNYPLAVPVNSPFGITYEIQDTDGNLCQGYYSFSDGLIHISANGSYSAPPDYTFEGLLSGTPGTRIETITLGLPLGQRWLNVSEGPDLNPYLTPWGAFYQYNGILGFLKDWDNVTINVTGAGFLWRLEQGWNLICVPANPVQKGGNGIFDSYDALNITFAITGDPGMSIANRLSGNPSAYEVFDMGMPENGAFPMNGVHGYWLYLTAPGPFVVNVTAQNYSVVGANVVNLAVGWNLLGFTHNISTGGAQPGGWNSALSASHFTNGIVDSDLNVPPRNKIVVTWWDPIVQWYHSYVVTPTFPGMPTHDWVYDTTYAYGYWVWTDAAVQITFDMQY